MAVAPAELAARPTRLMLGPIYVGQQAVGVVEVSNFGAASADVDVAISPPFSASIEQLHLVRGESREVVVTFAPTVAGHVSTLLRIGTLEVEVVGETLETPVCAASSVCSIAQFDLSAAQCLEAPRADGASCETQCVMGGCAGGTCVGQLKGCDDHDACTIDGCAEGAGCSHTPRTCPAAIEPCHAAKCDPLLGCGVEDVPDGTLCGPDDCAALDVDVCITGRCVRRTRNATGRCANRWASINVPVRSGAAMAYDAARQRLVLFGGNSGTDLRFDTWEWNGTAWGERIPANSPSAREGHAMAWDPVRQRVVLFGGVNWLPATTAVSDLWEWDGATWVERVSATAPPPRTNHGMAFDEARHRMVVFGGRSTTTGVRFSDTWEWDGTSWSERASASAPTPRGGHAMGYDARRQRVVIFGGSDASNALLADTWEWDGTTWLQKQPAQSPPAVSGRQFAYDAQRERMVLLAGPGSAGETWEWDGTNWSRSASSSPSGRGGYAIAWYPPRQSVVLMGGFEGGSRRSDTWEWDGISWVRVAEVAQPAPRRDFAMAYDAAWQRLVLFGGDTASETWAWNTDWGQLSPLRSPPPRSEHALVYDSVRQRVVLLGGRDGFVGELDDTWEWDGTSWLERTPRTSPSPRASRHAMAYDEHRQRVVLFSWEGTWEWDGTTWTQFSPPTSPGPRRDHAMAYDPIRQRVVLFGGSGGMTIDNSTWEWDGVTWTERVTPSAPSARGEHAMAWDTSRQRLVLFGGERSTPPLQDTWEWDGTSWTQRMPVTSPPRSSGHSMAFHRAANHVVVISGGDTWLFFP